MNLTTGNVNLNNNKVINLAAPTLDSDCATKLYVDSKIPNIVAGAFY